MNDFSDNSHYTLPKAHHNSYHYIPKYVKRNGLSYLKTFLLYVSVADATLQMSLFLSKFPLPHFSILLQDYDRDHDLLSF